MSSQIMSWLLLLAAAFASSPSLMVSSISGAEPPTLSLTPGSGLFEQNIGPVLQASPGSKVYFTTNGTPPSPANGRPWHEGIVLSNTTSFRAAQFIGDKQLGESVRATYIFPADVLRQTGAGFPAAWGNTNGRPVAAAYGMDQAIVSDPRWHMLMVPALKSIPTLSVQMTLQDLFDPATGVYANPLQSGPEWERPASVELVYPGNRRGFRVECGIRIQGGWNRRPEESPKHAFRFGFHKRYGPGKLRFRLFPDQETAEFETLILRAGCNNTWLHWSGEERRRAEFIRDQWMRDTLRDMGDASASGFFVHLYLNGLYWGVYNLSERPSAPFAAAHFGGKPKEYDSRNGDNILEGDDAAWKTLWSTAHAVSQSSNGYAALSSLLDVPQFADYMLANLYGANADWDGSSNWYAARRRRPPGPFRFFVWDAERTLESLTDSTVEAVLDDSSPPGLFQLLRRHPEFRLVFADRVQRHCFGDGPLVPGPAAERFNRRVQELDLAILAESARWGSYRRDFHPYKTGPYERYTRDDHWRPEVERLLNEYFPNRTAEFLRQLRAAGLYPELDAPVLRRAADGRVILSAPRGEIYFTRDGTDPRLPGGAIAPGAERVEADVRASAAQRIRARAAVSDANNVLTWSALAEFAADR